MTSPTSPLSHFDERGQAHMVDVAAKPATHRVAVAQGSIRMRPATYALIAAGQRSWFFAHHADYAAATTADRPADVMAAFKRAPHHLLDTRLMIAWAEALAQSGVSGDVDRARHIAARLREFHNPGADAFFAPCKDGAPAPRPFQCDPPSRLYSWRDFR